MKYHQGLAYDQINGSRASVIFCGGFASSMHGTKATALYEFCKENDVAFTRFGYSGHGDSEGELHDGNISKWLEDSLTILCDLTQGKQIIVGSSMGGWIMLLMALRYPGRIQSLIGIAVAPDFTQDLYNICSDEQKKQLKIQGYTYVPYSIDGDSYFVTNNLVADGKKNFILNKKSIPVNVPITLLHGMNDNIVNYTKSLELATKLESTEVSVQLLKNSDHSMNDEKSLAVLYRSILTYINK